MNNNKVKDWLINLGDYLGVGNDLHTGRILECNSYSRRFGVVLSDEDCEQLLQSRREVLKRQERFELNEGILPKLIFAFCDSPYIYQDNYVLILEQLQEMFYYYKNETLDELSDEELIEIMKEAFDGESRGSIEYLEGTILDRISRAVREDGYNNEEDW